MNNVLYKTNTIQLSTREKEVLQFIANGLTDKEISSELFLSPYTIMSYRKSLITKFAALNSCHLVYRACKMGYLN